MSGRQWRLTSWTFGLAVIVLHGAVAPADLFVPAPDLPPPPPMGIKKAELDAIIEKMDANKFHDRMEASKQLGKWIEDNKLSKDQYKQLREITGDQKNYSLEVRRNMERVLQEWTPRIKPVRDLLNNVQVYVGMDGKKQKLIFDSYSGPSPEGNPAYNDLNNAYNAVRNSVAGGNFDKPTTLKSLEGLRSAVSNLKDFEIRSLGLTNAAGQAVTRQDMLDRVDAALNGLDAAFDKIGEFSSNAKPEPRSMVPVGGGGELALGKTFSLNLNVQTPGQLDMFLPSYEPVIGLTMSAPPTGYKFVGVVLDVLAVDNLEVYGPVKVSIAFDPALDPTTLRMVRLANGRFDFLELDPLLPGADRLTGTYTPESLGGGLIQFGEFALVRAVPEPASLAIMTTALLLVSGAGVGVGRGRVRRRRETLRGLGEGR